MVVAVLTGCTALFAQERMSDEERQKLMAERIEKVAERTAKEFDLKGDAQKTFVSIFAEYQKEMFATNQPRGQRMERGESDEKKELTAEEATAKMQENFARQEQQIATMQKRLEVQKKYSEQFAKILTPQQLLKVMTPQRSQNQRSQGQNRGDGENRRGGFEGGPRGGGGFGGPRGGFGGGF